MLFGIDTRAAKTVLYFARIQLQRRYTGSWLGLAWSLLGPLTQIAAFSFVFNVVLRVPLDRYVLHMTAGFLPWLFMSTAIQTASTAYVMRRDQIIHSSIPFSLFVIGTVLAEFFTLLVAFGILLPLAAYWNGSIWWIYAIPIALLPCLVFAVAIGLVVARLTVFFRDIPHLLNVAFGLLFWFTPIVYHWSFLPEEAELVGKYNPMALLVSINQVVWHGMQMPSLNLALGCAVVVGVSLLLERWSRPLEKRLIFWL